nr:unnamed protein product [Callosobruchus chinensis]
MRQHRLVDEKAHGARHAAWHTATREKIGRPVVARVLFLRLSAEIAQRQLRKVFAAPRSVPLPRAVPFPKSNSVLAVVVPDGRSSYRIANYLRVLNGDSPISDDYRLSL